MCAPKSIANASSSRSSDEGGGFDLETSEIDPTSPENLMREDGRGLFLMRRLMDSVERFDDQATSSG